MRIPWTLLLTGLLCAPMTYAQTPKTDISGVWLGALTTPGGSLRLQLHLETGAHGVVGCAMDSLDQHAFQIACTLRIQGDGATIEVPAVRGRWVGHIGTDGGSLTGTWSQGGDLPLSFSRQATAIPATR